MQYYSVKLAPSPGDIIGKHFSDRRITIRIWIKNIEFNYLIKFFKGALNKSPFFFKDINLIIDNKIKLTDIVSNYIEKFKGQKTKISTDQNNGSAVPFDRH